MEMTVGESLIGGLSAVLLGAEIEELARRASGAYFEVERCYWEFGDIFKRAAGLWGSFDEGFFGGAEDGSADREVSLRDPGANGSFKASAAVGVEEFNYSAVLENVVYNAMRTSGAGYSDRFAYPAYYGYAANGLLELPGSSYGVADRVLGGAVFDEFDRDILESCLVYGNGAENSERSVWFNGADESGYLYIKASAEDLYYGLGGADSGLPEPPGSFDIAFGAAAWNSGSSARYETAQTGLAFGEDNWVAASLPRLIGFSEFSDVYGVSDMPRMSGDELVTLRNSAARVGASDSYSANAEISADSGLEFFGGNDAFYADDFRGAVDTDYITDYLVSGLKNALESGAEGVHS